MIPLSPLNFLFFPVKSRLPRGLSPYHETERIKDRFRLSPLLSWCVSQHPDSCLFWTLNERPFPEVRYRYGVSSSPMYFKDPSTLKVLVVPQKTSSLHVFISLLHISRTLSISSSSLSTGSKFLEWLFLLLTTWSVDTPDCWTLSHPLTVSYLPVSWPVKDQGRVGGVLKSCWDFFSHEHPLGS